MIGRMKMENDVIKVKIKQSALNYVRSNALLRIEKLLKEAREYEKEARARRTEIKALKDIIDNGEMFEAIDVYEEMLRAEGKTDAEIEELIYEERPKLIWELIKDTEIS